MPQRSNRDIENKLVTKFQFSPSQRAADHRWYELTLPDLPKIATCFSHGKQSIGPDLWKRIAHQLRVRPRYLDGMIDCSNDKEAYYEQVRNNPFPPWPLDLKKRSSESK
jgi:hypothetical protein